MLGKELVEAVFADWKTAPVRDELRAALGLVECLTIRPEEFDVADAREAQLSDQAIQDVVTICSLFNLITRLADALGFEVPSPELFERNAGKMLARGYS